MTTGGMVAHQSLEAKRKIDFDAIGPTLQHEATEKMKVKQNDQI
jgi:hypothetical protein